MQMAIPTISVKTAGQFRRWLVRHHTSERVVAVVVHKRHTGVPAPTHRQLMDEAICFGWIDTTLKRVDEDRYIRRFARRTANSTWSSNTRRYARELIASGRMAPEGLRFYKLGLKKKTLDHGIPKNPSLPHELEEALAGDAKANATFRTLPPSTKRMLYRWLLTAKRPETKAKRIARISALLRRGQRKFF